MLIYIKSVKILHDLETWKLFHPASDLITIISVFRECLECLDLQPAKQRVLSLWADHMQEKSNLMPIIMKYSNNHDSSLFIQFLLDCTVLADVRELKKQLGDWVYDSLLYLTRTFCFSIHKSRLKLLGKWNKKYWQTLLRYKYLRVRFIYFTYDYHTYIYTFILLYLYFYLYDPTLFCHNCLFCFSVRKWLIVVQRINGIWYMG